jgi:hypothetical protein
MREFQVVLSSGVSNVFTFRFERVNWFRVGCMVPEIITALTPERVSAFDPVNQSHLGAMAGTTMVRVSVASVRSIKNFLAAGRRAQPFAWRQPGLGICVGTDAVPEAYTSCRQEREVTQLGDAAIQSRRVASPTQVKLGDRLASCDQKIRANSKSASCRDATYGFTAPANHR